MLELCGQPYNDEDIEVFFGLDPLDDEVSLDCFGVEEWSVVDVISEENENAPSDLQELGSDGVYRANYEGVTSEDPEFAFRTGELQEVNELSLTLSGRSDGV